MYRTQAEEYAAPHQSQSYYQDINQISLLSAAEERELADSIARGDRDARGRMIKANLRLVVKIARDYMGRGLVLDDLVGEGNLGLIRAAEEYDPAFGTRFSTYASYWIKQAIRHALINTTATIRLPAHMYTLLTKWRRAERLLCRQLGGPPSFDEVAAYLGLSETQKGLVAKAHRARQLKLESSLGDGHGTWSPEESADATEAVEDSYEISDERAEVLRRMDWLDDRERLVLSLRYGLAGEQPRTLKEIGERLGVTREWVRKIELKAVSKMASKTPPAASTSFARAAATKPRARRTSPFAATAGASSWR
jgi:RNA polymerase primary sigma factor